MERGHVVFGLLFLALPLLAAVGMVVFPGAAFPLTVLIIALLTFGFMAGIAFLDLGGSEA